MKRGKEDDKVRGPMFPRLHVNDVIKGGPRAPPRNKMALYEQLTVPSQRHNSGAVPFNPNTNSSVVPSTTTSQGMGLERNMYFPHYEPTPAPSHSANELQVRRLEAVSSSDQLAQVENKKKPVEDDDFMVPIFSQPGKGQYSGQNQNSIDGEQHTQLVSNHSILRPSACEEINQQNDSEDVVSRRHVINLDGRNLRVSDAPIRYSSDISARNKVDEFWRDGTSVQREDHQQRRLSSLEKTDVCLLQECVDGLPANTTYGEGVSDQQLERIFKEISSRLKGSPNTECGYRGANAVDDGTQRTENDHSLEQENVERDDDVSETSMVDCASGLDISPDEVVAIIGQKHFWKARIAISNQQRVFAVQVFELHRLIKVQRLIAGSPHFLLEGGAFVGKSSSKGSTVKALAHTIKLKNDLHNPTDKTEGTAENVVAKAPVPSQNAIQATGCHRPSVNPVTQPAANIDPTMNPWSFHHPAQHQWLVPVMSPSEGLVYKPYPATGFTGPIYGGCGPMVPSPMASNLMYPSHGTPTHDHHGMGGPPGIPFGGQGYFPLYCMPTRPGISGSSVDEMNQFSGPNPFPQAGQSAGSSLNIGTQHQGSCDVPSQKDGSAPAVRALPPKEAEPQKSTADNPSERAEGTGIGPLTGEGDALPLFPTAPATEKSEGDPQTEKPARVIRVVPHNPRSTRESAARIFQCIQEERRYYDSN